VSRVLRGARAPVPKAPTVSAHAAGGAVCEGHGQGGTPGDGRGGETGHTGAAAFTEMVVVALVLPAEPFTVKTCSEHRFTGPISKHLIAELQYATRRA
jgi:hypothetical protein